SYHSINRGELSQKNSNERREIKRWQLVKIIDADRSR
ncbi:MAG: hypothetical protein ACI9T9_001347, partial [Oleiphilaceae bacterium]